MAVSLAVAAACGTSTVPTADRSAPTATTAAVPTLQHIARSRYRLLGDRGPLGFTDLTIFTRADGSRSHLARERMEFWGPVLDRFVVLTFDAGGRFDSGHWVGTSRYSPSFTYTMRSDGRVIRGDWEDDVRGRGWSEVATTPRTPVMGFWGPLESLVLDRFDPAGPARQVIPVVDVEDSHHRAMDILIERLGPEAIDVPAGRFAATHYRSERFGVTDHWRDADGTIIRWSSEQGSYRWDLERYPGAEPLPTPETPVAAGRYEVTSGGSGSLSGHVAWSIDVGGDGGGLRITGDEELNVRRSRFVGVLDANRQWTGSTETVHFSVGEGAAGPEIHHLETFFHRSRVHLLRFRDRAYPLLQSRGITGPTPFLPLNYPVTAVALLADHARQPGVDQTIPALAHIGNRYRGGGLEIQEARIRYGGPMAVEGPAGRVAGHHFVLRYDGGWNDSTVELWTDRHGVPLRAIVNATDGPLEYRLVDYEVTDASRLPAMGAESRAR